MLPTFTSNTTVYRVFCTVHLIVRIVRPLGKRTKLFPNDNLFPIDTPTYL